MAGERTPACGPASIACAPDIQYVEISGRSSLTPRDIKTGDLGSCELV